MSEMRARMRSEVFSVMEDQEERRRAMPPENAVINELIREYLTYNDYGHTLNVFVPEAALPAAPLDRAYIAQQAQLPPGDPADASPAQLPLLYSLFTNPPQQQRPPHVSSQPATASPQPATASQPVRPRVAMS